MFKLQITCNCDFGFGEFTLQAGDDIISEHTQLNHCGYKNLIFFMRTDVVITPRAYRICSTESITGSSHSNADDTTHEIITSTSLRAISQRISDHLKYTPRTPKRIPNTASKAPLQMHKRKGRQILVMIDRGTIVCLTLTLHKISPYYAFGFHRNLEAQLKFTESHGVRTYWYISNCMRIRIPWYM